MLQFSNNKIRQEWQGKKFIPSEVKDIKPVTSKYAVCTLVGDKNTGALMVKKEYTGKMKGKKPTELWVIVGEDKTNRKREGVLVASDVAEYLKKPTTSFDKFLADRNYSLYCVKGYYMGGRSTASSLIAKTDFFELEVHDMICEPSEFTIFGKDADYEQFGVKEDIDCDYGEWGCQNMKFTAFTDEAKIEACCKEYSIDRAQFDEICKALDEGLSFGECGACV